MQGGTAFRPGRQQGEMQPSVHIKMQLQQQLLYGTADTVWNCTTDSVTMDSPASHALCEYKLQCNQR